MTFPNAPHPDGNGNSAIPVDWERLARSTAHPVQVSILEILGRDGGRILSPVALSRELNIPLSNTNYHVRQLAKSDLIELAGKRPVRGATEHFYRLAESMLGPRALESSGATAGRG